MLDNPDPFTLYDDLARHLSTLGKLTLPALDRAQRVQAETGKRLPTVLTRLGLITERDLAEAQAAMLDLPLVGPKDFPETPVLEDRINRQFLKQSHLIPLAEEGGGLVVAMADPFDDFAVTALSYAVGKPVIRRVAYPADIEAAYERLYEEGWNGVGQMLDAEARGRRRRKAKMSSG